MTASESTWASVEPPLDDGEADRVIMNRPRSVTGHDEPPSWDPPKPPAPFSNSHPGFGGTFVTEDSVLSGSLEFQGSRLIMWGGGNPLLVWGPGECLLERLTANRFVLSADGDTITFTADDPDGLDDMLSRHSFGPVQTSATGEEVISIGPAPVDVKEHLDPIPAEAVPAEASPQPTYAEPFPIAEPEPAEPESRVLEPVPNQAPDPDEPAVTLVDDPAVPTPIRGRRPFIKAMRVSSAVVDPELTEVETTEDQETEDGATIADLALTRARKLSKVRPRRWLPTNLQAVAVKVGLVSGAVVIVMGFAFAVLLILGGGNGGTESEGELSPTTSIVTVPTTVATTVPPPPADLKTPVFDLSATAFAERWNLYAAELDETLLLSPNISNPFSLVMTPYMTFDGILDPLGGSLRLRATPTGTVDGDRRILVAIALVIGTAEPSLTPDQRGQLVQELGLDIEGPDMAAISGARTYNGLRYEMDFLEEEGVLQFTVRPEGSVVTTIAP